MCANNSELEATPVHWPAPPWVRTLSTTRNGGVSEGPWHSLNLGAHCQDDPAAVRANRALIQARMGVEPLWLDQVHGSAVVEITPALRASKAGELTTRVPLPVADAAITWHPGMACGVLSADCLPLLLCHRNRPLVGAVHAGWRGLAAGVVEAAVRAMQAEPAELLAWLGPCIGPTAFEVGEEVRARFLAWGDAAEQGFIAGSNIGGWYADLAQLARLRLQALGITECFGGHWCTHTDAAHYFSWRRDGHRTGRMGHFIWIERI